MAERSPQCASIASAVPIAARPRGGVMMVARISHQQLADTIDITQKAKLQDSKSP